MPVYKIDAIQRTRIEVEVEGDSPDKAWHHFLHELNRGSVIVDDGETAPDPEETVLRYLDTPTEYDWINCRELTVGDPDDTEKA